MMLLGQRKRNREILGRAGMVPRSSTQGRSGATTEGRRGLPGAGDDQEPRKAAGSLCVLGTAQTLHCSDYA